MSQRDDERRPATQGSNIPTGPTTGEKTAERLPYERPRITLRRSLAKAVLSTETVT